MIPLDLLDEVNHKVNHTLTYTPDGLVDKWEQAAFSEASLRGDCEDFAIVKASRLIHIHGCSSADMMIGKFRTKIGYHAMLVVNGEKKKGFFKREFVPCLWVLDNRTDNIFTIDQIRDKLILQYKVDAFI